MAVIAVIGVNGKIGKPVLDALLKTDSTIRVLTHSNCEIKGVEQYVIDTNNPETLNTALQGVDVLVNTASSRSNHTAIVDAAVAQGVKVYFPSDFDMDFDATPYKHVFAGKLKALEYARAQPFKCIEVKCGFFGEYMLTHSFNMGLDVASGVYTQFGNGDAPVTITFLTNVGEVVATVARRALTEPCAIPNKIKIQGDLITPNQYVELYEQQTGQNFKRQVVDHQTAVTNAETINSKEKFDRVEKFQVIQSLPTLGLTQFRDNNNDQFAIDWVKFKPQAERLWSDGNFHQEEGL